MCPSFLFFPASSRHSAAGGCQTHVGVAKANSQVANGWQAPFMCNQDFMEIVHEIQKQKARAGSQPKRYDHT